MRSDLPSTTPVALFLFAHQDDEFGVYYQILRELRSGRRVLCAYLTNGAWKGIGSQVRNLESIHVLTQLGVDSEHVLFPGEALGIADGKLPENLHKVTQWIDDRLSTTLGVSSIYVPAWEGGHQDHDALHAAACHVAATHGLLNSTQQFPLYNAYRCPSPLFRVLAPLKANGTPIAHRIPWLDRLKFVRYCLSYRSQAKTWMALFPFVLLHYVMDGRQSIQPVDVKRLQAPPHRGAPLYETRGYYTWAEMRHQIHPFV